MITSHNNKMLKFHPQKKHSQLRCATVAVCIWHGLAVTARQCFMWLCVRSDGADLWQLNVVQGQNVDAIQLNHSTLTTRAACDPTQLFYDHDKSSVRPHSTIVAGGGTSFVHVDPTS